jgi:long-chain acyl-CoA synthetase
MAMSFTDAVAAVCAPGTPFEITEAEVRGIKTKVFAGTPPNIKTLFELASLRGDAEFLIYEDERWSMNELLAHAGQVGDMLVNQLGVKKGDRVSIAMRNYPEWISTFVAITCVGAVAVPLNAWWEHDELVFGMEDSGSVACFIDSQRLDRISGLDVSAQLVVVRPEGTLPDGVVDLAEKLVDGATMPEVEIGPEDNVTILYTSGTTGTPKGAVSTHRAILSALMAFGGRAAVAGLVEPPAEPPSEDDPTPAFVLAVPLFHVTGLVPVLLGSFLGGARLVMMYRWDPERALELIERERVTTFVGVPTMAFDLIESPSFETRDTSTLTSIGGGGAPMPPELVRRIDASFSKGRPGLGYGMTETNAYGPQNTGDAFITHPTSTGRALPIMDLRVTDADGNVLGPGELGEIWFKGPNLISGYWNRPEATAETIIDGWLKSGDIGRIDEDGFVYVVDRAKDMVLRGGENVYCAEVEGAIYTHPAVHEAAVYGLPDERLGEEVAATIMVKSGQTLTAQDISAHLAGTVASFKIPRIIEIVETPMPRNAAGKILKRQIRDEKIASAS